MKLIHRRSFLELAVAALPAPLFGQTPSLASPTAELRVPAGMDREGKEHAIGLSSTTYKVLTRDTAGALFVMEQSNHKKGGPRQHVHHGEDVTQKMVRAAAIVEVGSERFRLQTGDCVLGPRGVPHAWAFAGESAGRLLLSWAPAGKIEAYFNELERTGTRFSSASDTVLMRSYGMELTGPAIVLD